jgi:hypothetical protein
MVACRIRSNEWKPLGMSAKAGFNGGMIQYLHIAVKSVLCPVCLELLEVVVERLCMFSLVDGCSREVVDNQKWPKCAMISWMLTAFFIEYYIRMLTVVERLCLVWSWL